MAFTVFGNALFMCGVAAGGRLSLVEVIEFVWLIGMCQRLNWLKNKIIFPFKMDNNVHVNSQCSCNGLGLTVPFYMGEALHLYFHYCTSTPPHQVCVSFSFNFSKYCHTGLIPRRLACPLPFLICQHFDSERNWLRRFNIFWGNGAFSIVRWGAQYWQVLATKQTFRTVL